MANVFSRRTEHSAEYFGDSRDYWWNDDYLALALQRWRAQGISNLLDVGCGVGHWGRAWARVLPPDTAIFGVDREPCWVAEASRRAEQAGLLPRCQYQTGEAAALPFAEGSFNFVTCQTLLIHVPDPRVVLAEMFRVTRPGGLIAVAEPNNAGIPVIEDALAVGSTDAEAAALLHFHLTCLRGKAALGLGDETVGRRLPSLLRQTGLTEISVGLSDKAFGMSPPYSSARERALAQELVDWADRDFWIWNRADTARYFRAGGGLSGDEFERFWRVAMGVRRRLAQAVEAHQYACAGGGLFYLAAGRKPSLERTE